MNEYSKIEKIIMKEKSWSSCEINNCTDASIKFAKILSDIIKEYSITNLSAKIPLNVINSIKYLALLGTIELDLEDKWIKYYLRILIDDIYMNIPENIHTDDYITIDDGILEYLFLCISYKDNQESIFSEFCENYSFPSECDDDYVYYLSRDGFSISEIAELLEMNPEEVQDAIDSYGSFID